MKKSIYFMAIFILIATLISCHKDNLVALEEECLLTNLKNPIGGNEKRPYFYDSQNRIVGSVKYVFGRNPDPRFSYIITAVYDTVIYGNNIVTVYSLDAFDPIDSIHIPAHQPINKYFEKAVAEYSDGKMSLINYYRVNGTSDYLNLKKEIEYQNAKVSRIKVTGYKELCSAFLSSQPRTQWETQTEYVYNYINADSLQVLGTTKLLNGSSVGNDTLNVSFMNLKNPLTRDKNLPFIFFNPVSERVSKYENYGSSFLFPDGSSCQSSYKQSVPIYSDNGKGYAKEVGNYKCD
jgi:hypothetical protein